MGSSSTTSSTSRRIEKRGFTQKDFSSFLQKGSTLASNDIKNIERFKPKEKVQSVDTTTTTKRGFLSRNRSIFTQRVGAFSDPLAEGVTQANIDNLVQRFQLRQQEIKTRRGLAGRTQLFQERT